MQPQHGPQHSDRGHAPAHWGPVRRRRVPPDPGSPGTARLAGLLTILLIIVAATLQQFSAAAPPPAPPLHEIQPPATQFEITAKVYTRIYAAMPEPRIARDALAALNAEAEFPEDRLRVAIIAAELHDADAALDRLDILEADLQVRLESQATGPLPARIQPREEIVTPELPIDTVPDLGLPAEPTELAEAAPSEAEADPAAAAAARQAAYVELLQDIEALRLIYEGRQAEVDQAQIDQLAKNHGWFGRVAATHNLASHAPERQELLGGGLALVFILAGLMIGGFVALLTGFVLLILAIIWFSTGKLRPHFNPPAAGGSVAIETVAVFVASFVALKIITQFLPFLVGDAAAGLVGIVLQWTLVLTILWPLVRGVSLRNTFNLWGLHRGRGVLTEIGCGIVGYIACLPLLLVGVLTTLILMMLYGLLRTAMGLPDPPTPRNPVIDMVAGSPPLVLILIFLLATIWAPLVEEIIFRGALYRFLRSSWHWLLAGIVTAFAFGLMHGYQLLMLGPVISLGFGFALLREWRGSLIASMTAHAVHNSLVLLILMTVVRFIIA